MAVASTEVDVLPQGLRRICLLLTSATPAASTESAPAEGTEATALSEVTNVSRGSTEGVLARRSNRLIVVSLLSGRGNIRRWIKLQER